jgi:hypothetical protein
MNASNTLPVFPHAAVVVSHVATQPKAVVRPTRGGRLSVMKKFLAALARSFSTLTV